MRLSIIIPVYNVEDYLPKCLDSVFHQDIHYSDYEVIIINDGSPDNSENIIQNYLTKYPNIKYLNQPNRGPGGARNNGIKHAEGDYIWFVDADDTITPNCLGGLLDYAEKLDLDFCGFGYMEISGNEHHFVRGNFHINNKVISNDEFIISCAMPSAACFNLIKRRLLEENSLSFVEGIYHEDLELNIRILSCSSRISHFDSEMGLYNYVINREGSTMTNTKLPHTLKRINSYIYILKSIKDNFQYNPLHPDYSFYIHRMANDIMAYFLLPVIEESAIPNKQEFFRDKVLSENLTYNVKIMNGIQKCKFGILSLFRSNYRVSRFTLSAFDHLAILKRRISNVFGK